jgi:hypothetical protein
MPSEAEQIRHAARNPIQCLRLHYNQLAGVMFSKDPEVSRILVGMQKQIARIELALSPTQFLDDARGGEESR